MAHYAYFTSGVAMLPVPVGMVVYGAWASENNGEWLVEGQDNVPLAIVARNQVLFSSGNGKQEPGVFTLAELMHADVEDFDTRYEILFLRCDGVETLRDANDCSNAVYRLIAAADDLSRTHIKQDALEKSRKSNERNKK